MTFNNVCITLIVGIGSLAVSLANANELSDEEITKLLIGQWHCDASKEADCSFSISTYHQDGTLDFLGYKTAECKNIMEEVKASWVIKDQQLVITITGGSSTTKSAAAYKLIEKENGVVAELSQKIPVGEVIKDEVISITDKALVLMSDEMKHYRLRGDICKP